MIGLMLVLIIVSSAANAQTKHFKGFYYEMPKSEVLNLIDQKIDSNVMHLHGAGMSKRHVIFHDINYKSRIGRTVTVLVKFKHVRGKLAIVELRPYSVGSLFSGGMSRKKATVVKNELEERFSDLGYEIDFDMDKIDQGYYNLYMPVGYVELDEFDYTL